MYDRNQSIICLIDSKAQAALNIGLFIIDRPVVERNAPRH